MQTTLFFLGLFYKWNVQKSSIYLKRLQFCNISKCIYSLFNQSQMNQSIQLFITKHNKQTNNINKSLKKICENVVKNVQLFHKIIMFWTNYVGLFTNKCNRSAFLSFQISVLYYWCIKRCKKSQMYSMLTCLFEKKPWRVWFVFGVCELKKS